MSSSPDKNPRLTEIHARQGLWERPVFWVLAISLILAMLAMIGVWLWHSGMFSSVPQPG